MRFLSSSLSLSTVMIMTIIILIGSVIAQRRQPRNYNQVSPLSLGPTPPRSGGNNIGGGGGRQNRVNNGINNNGGNGRGGFLNRIFNRRGGGGGGGRRGSRF